MKKFKCYDGEEVDLDDPNLYVKLPDSIEELRNFMFQEIGYYYCYTKFWHKDVFGKNNDQKKRVKEIIKNFTKNEKDNRNNIMWYKQQIFIFQDEIENMC